MSKRDRSKPFAFVPKEKRIGGSTRKKYKQTTLKRKKLFTKINNKKTKKCNEKKNS
jgi:hypothetical protein